MPTRPEYIDPTTGEIAAQISEEEDIPIMSAMGLVFEHLPVDHIDYDVVVDDSPEEGEPE